METDSKPGRTELVQRLQAISRHAAADPNVPLPDLASQLTTLVEQIRGASNVGGGGEPSTSAPARTHVATSASADDEGAAGNGEAGGDGTGDGTPLAQPAKKQKRAPREFDFGRYRTRYVALELMYVGWAFQGFARQDNTENTIEGVLFSALRKTKLIPEAAAKPISELAYSRCGRTDRGVSALGQVVALQLRSCARVEEPEADVEQEFDYPRLINKALPPEVRILGWTPVPADFNARFSCLYRQYKYFIIQQRLPQPPLQLPQLPTLPPAPAAAEQDAGDPGAAEPGPGSAADAAAASSQQQQQQQHSLDIQAMRTAAAHFIGEHDFRNFCKPDVATVRSFRRRILSFTVEPVTTSAADAAHQVYALTVRGTAFLWHQVRCMAAILLMVGRGQEAPDVVARLLDVEACPRKPQYSMAPEEPLLLYACGFPSLQFRRTHAAVEANLVDVASLLHRHLIGAALTAACHSRLAEDTRCAETASTSSGGAGAGAGAGAGGRGSGHVPLMRRQTEPSIEERFARRGLPWPPEPLPGGSAAAAEEDDGMGE
ncbi:hypothetical protein CHLRE_02g086050v5 [Chlamydomonas reinhardtii]|uniref:Pseudouridine synthase I TruA alpha/beta domain-containing protein n=1 Tax=Chlamydomonas reinhardtii TaxID=3055 RepID=A0A2K3E0W3_CHLRE|nr:uncharacterized protein CHLRE_02g086050v5 [Chlamydomonas reinhardtii]PNW86426.1 hypothetical protein CHLRE_02g086050v5 [Chlamydomonas reinhardtii]